MIVVNIMGGLGNQLFMYAMYRQTVLYHKECYVDIGWFKNEQKDFWYPYQLDKLGLRANILERDQYCVKEYYIKNNQMDEVQFEIYKKNIKVPILKLVTEKDSYSSETLWEKDNSYLYGYFQNIDNCEKALPYIKSEIVFPEYSNKQNQSLKIDIQRYNSVAVHVRMNDYADIECFEQICTKEYYLYSIDYMNQVIENAKFYIFSNNIEKAKRVLGVRDNFCFVEYHDRMNGIGDMELITLCKHAIIGNSTFGWWGAALNKNLDAIIIAPKKWKDCVNGKTDYEFNLCLNNWISI